MNKLPSLDLVNVFIHVDVKGTYKTGGYHVTVFYNNPIIKRLNISNMSLKRISKVFENYTGSSVEYGEDDSDRALTVKQFENLIKDKYGLNDSFAGEEFVDKNNGTFIEPFQVMNFTRDSVKLKFHNDGFSTESIPNETYSGETMHLTSSREVSLFGAIYVLKLITGRPNWRLVKIYINNEFIPSLIANEDNLDIENMENAGYIKEFLELYHALEYKVRFSKVSSTMTEYRPSNRLLMNEKSFTANK